jgi:uncharacterized protein YndB with AHSA1/START domain
MTAAVRLSRTIPATPERVYRAWLDPELIRRWMAPGDLEVLAVEVDEKVGGAYRVWQGVAEREGGGFEAELLELVPGRRVVFRWGFVGPNRDESPRYDSLLTVTFEPTADGATQLTLVHERLEDLAAAMPDVAAMVGVGWNIVLDKLESLLHVAEGVA